MTKGRENLISLGERTTVEQREICSKGGIASGKARRERKLLKEYFEILLACSPGEELAVKFAGMGIGLKDQNYAMVICMALITKAVSGDVAAFKEIRSLVGEETDTKATDSIFILDDV